MVRYVVLLTLTEKGIAAVKDSPNRAESFRAAAAKAGVSIETLFWTVGQYDGMIVLNAPDEAAAAAVVLELGKGNHTRSCMLRAFDADEFRNILGKMP